VNSPGWPGFWDLYQSHGWDPEVLDAIGELDGTFVDIGAWCGPTTRWALDHGAQRVVAVEPDPAALTALHDNLTDPRLEVVEAAIAPHNGTVELWQHGVWGGSMSTVVRLAHDTSITVQAYTLPTLWSSYEIPSDAVVKMDIEGAEVDILETHASWLRSHCARLVLETHQSEHAALAALDGWACRSLKPRQWECTP
jgi:FkbM family methyltransferase